MVRVPTNRISIHPGEILLLEFLEPMGITYRDLANKTDIPEREVEAIVNGKLDIEPSVALHLGKFFNVSSDFWMNLQNRYNLSNQSELVDLSKNQPDRNREIEG